MQNLALYLDLLTYMRLVAAISLFIILWSITADAKEARSCSSKFRQQKVFANHTSERRGLMKEALKEACYSGLSDGQIAGRVLKSCMQSCEGAPQKEDSIDPVELLLSEEEKRQATAKPPTGAQCKQSCLGTVQKMAKESQRLRRLLNAKR